MSDYDLVVTARRAIVDGAERPASIGVREGVIAAISDGPLVGVRRLDLADDEVLLPGLVDSHVHVNEPGRTEWEGFRSATRAAAAGGVTTIVDMPLNSIPATVDVPALEVKRAVAAEKAFVDVGFWGGAVPESLGGLKALHEAGVFGFKCFTLPSGVDEFPPLDGEQLLQAMAEISSFDGLLIVHAEDPRLIEQDGAPEGRRYAHFLASRPAAAENSAIAGVIEGSERTGCRVHLLHLSSSEALPELAAARARGVRITAETCPHYLTLNAEDVPDGATEFKCCPPIRDTGNRDLLWAALREGVLDMVVSDHSPATADLKRLDTGDFGQAWGGISSLQLGLSLLWTHGRGRGVELAQITRWMSTAPADLTGLSAKGRLEVGAAADFCVFAPDDHFVVDPAHLHHRNPVTPYAGQKLDGVVRSTWLAGDPIDLSVPPRGRLLRKEAR